MIHTVSIKLMFLVAVLVMLDRRIGNAGENTAPRSPEEVIERIVRSRHGLLALEFYDKEAAVLLKTVLDQPQNFLPALVAKFNIPNGDLRKPMEEWEREFGICLSILQRIGSEDAGSHVRHVYVALTSIARSQDQPAANNKPSDAIVGAAIRLRKGTLDVLRQFSDPFAIDEALHELPSADRTLQETFLRYLEAVAPLRPDIRPKVEEMYNSQASPLRNHPQLLQVLEAMDAASKKSGEGSSEDRGE